MDDLRISALHLSAGVHYKIPVCPVGTCRILGCPDQVRPLMVTVTV